MKKFLFLLFPLILILGCNKNSATVKSDDHGHEEEIGQSEGQVELNDEAREIAGIETKIIKVQDFQHFLQVPGTVTSTDRGKAVVTPPVAGRVISISVRLGDEVRQGQTLAVIESPELSQSWSIIADATRLRDSALAELQQTQSEVKLAQAKLSAAKASLKSQQELAKAGAFSQAPVQQAQSELNDAQSELLSIQKEQASHAEQVRRLENLYRDGIVSKSELEAARLELQQDEIRLNRAQARIDAAKATYEREKNIASRGLLNAKELQTAEAELKSSEIELERSKIRVRSAESALANANRAIANAQAVYRSNSGSGASSVGRVALTAPISGIVTHLDVTKGQAVDRTQVLLEVENLRSVWVTANVPERDLDKVRKGAFVSVHIESFPDREFKGIVQVLGTKVDPKTRSVAVQCLVTETNKQLKPEMFGKVFIGIGKPIRGLVIPTSALVVEGGKSFVFAKHNEVFEKHEVTLGDRNLNSVVVLTGIEAGEEVVTNGAFILSSEQKKGELKGHEH